MPYIADDILYPHHYLVKIEVTPLGHIVRKVVSYKTLLVIFNVSVSIKHIKTAFYNFIILNK